MITPPPTSIKGKKNIRNSTRWGQKQSTQSFVFTKNKSKTDVFYRMKAKQLSRRRGFQEQHFEDAAKFENRIGLKDRQNNEGIISPMV